MTKLVEVGLEKVEESAAYGTMAVNASRTLLTMHGAELPEEAGNGDARKTPEEVGGAFRLRSLIIMARLEQLERAKARAADLGFVPFRRHSWIHGGSSVRSSE